MGVLTAATSTIAVGAIGVAFCAAATLGACALMGAVTGLTVAVGYLCNVQIC
jgi:hypothetical protein